jgi:hypothetical protein
MANPLQQYFRQPKIYIKLPSNGVYNSPGSLQGDLTKMPVYGMTGMDEIILKTPDALLSGESTVKVIESCIPSIKDAWSLSVIDLPMVLAGMRIATYGSELAVTHTCAKCSTENEYDLDVSRIIEYFTNCQYDSTIALKELTLKIQPLTYKQSTEFAMRNFQLQQKLSQVDTIEDDQQRQEAINGIFKELGTIQNDIYIATVDSVDTGSLVVTEKPFITEWLQNCDKSIFDEIRKKIDANRERWQTPSFPVKCDNCGNEINLSVDLDQSNFFARA